MTVPGLAILFTYGLIVTLWKVLHVLLLFYKPKRYFLSLQSPRLRGDEGPLLSILLPAKDEEPNIGACVRSVLDSEYTRFELIVIDDRSTDRTSEEVALAAAGDPRVRLLRVGALPDGWTGKMNAVRQGLGEARGDLILIMDADTRHAPQALGVALAAQRGRNIDLLSLLPRFDHRSFLSRMVQPIVGALIFLWKPLPLVNSRKRKHVAMGWGGFLLLRRECLEAVGGLEEVRDRFAADIALVRLMKRAGCRVRLLHAPDLICTYMYTSFREMVNGWSRILRITMDNRPSRLLATLAATALLSLSAYVAIGVGAVELIRGGVPRDLARVIRGGGDALPLAIGMMGLMHLAVQLTLLGRFFRISGTNPVYVLGHLPATLFTCFLVALGLVRCGSSSMTWRGTSYHLSRDGRARSAAGGRPHFGDLDAKGGRAEAGAGSGTGGRNGRPAS